ncbi:MULTISPECIES: FRG domain-containing protein [unclassified Adlercreutzia]|uniref:FRG domain-containing protein n=1 Tax=unclassified Adlercreutzia TaxID=2636013 RepID=UPI0013EBE94D|nr:MULTISPECIES: FRG domain-containing protein [unclassified Adlercreutzia]
MEQAEVSSGTVMLEVPKTLAELLELLNEGALQESYVWREQSNYMWPLFPSLYRRLRCCGFADSQIDESLVRCAEALLVEHAKLESLLDEKDDDCLGLMAQIQHYGGATRLLDVTHDPLVALFFSLGDLSTKGVVHRAGASIRLVASMSRTALLHGMMC